MTDNCLSLEDSEIFLMFVILKVHDMAFLIFFLGYRLDVDFRHILYTSWRYVPKGFEIKKNPFQRHLDTFRLFREVLNSHWNRMRTKARAS